MKWSYKEGYFFFSTEKDRKSTEMLLISLNYTMAYETGKIESNASF